jgi:hypothetical protein
LRNHATLRGEVIVLDEAAYQLLRRQQSGRWFGRGGVAVTESPLGRILHLAGCYDELSLHFTTDLFHVLGMHPGSIEGHWFEEPPSDTALAHEYVADGTYIWVRPVGREWAPGLRLGVVRVLDSKRADRHLEVPVVVTPPEQVDAPALFSMVA